MLVISCLAGLYFIALYWINAMILRESDRVVDHAHKIEEKLDRLMAVLDASGEQALDVINELSDCDKED